MASSTVPPQTSPVTSLYLSDTFYTWFNKTNDVITKVNPIEVYSITADQTPQAEGITLSADGYGNWTIGYILGATIPNGHTFMGNIHFNAGVSGTLVNKFNGHTGEVTGVETVSGRAPVSIDGNVESALFIINGITGSTAGAMTLGATGIEGTVSSITAGAGYMLTTDSAGSGFTFPVRMFGSRPGTTQNALSINATGGVLGNWVSINGYTGSKVGNTYASATVYGTGSRTAIITTSDVANSPDLFMTEQGSICANNRIFFLANAGMVDGLNSGTTAGPNAAKFDFREGDYRSGGGNSLLQLTAAGRFNVPVTTHYKFQENGANVLEIENTTGKLILGNNSNANIHLDNTLGGMAQIGWNGDDLQFKKAGSAVFGIGDVGEVQLGSGLDEGSSGQILVSQGGGVAPTWAELDTTSQTGFVPITSNSTYRIAQSSPYQVTSVGLVQGGNSTYHWQGKSVMVNVPMRVYAHEGTPAKKKIYWKVQSGTSAPTSWGSSKQYVLSRADGDGTSYEEIPVTISATIPKLHTLWLQVVQLPNSVSTNPEVTGYNWMSI